MATKKFPSPSITLDLRLPMAPETTDPILHRELSIVYGAIRQIANGVDKFLDIPAQPKNAAYTIGYLDRGRSIDTTANVTIPKEDTAGYEFPLGCTVSVINVSNAPIQITPETGVTLILAGTTTLGARTVAKWGAAVIRRIAADTWLCYGAGVS